MTTPTPPRLTGSINEDLRAITSWAWDLYRALIIEDDVTVLDLAAVAPLIYDSATRGIEIDETGNDGDILKFVGGVWTVVAPASGGGVNGPSSSSVNSIAVWQNITGTELLNTPVTVDSLGNVGSVKNITISGNLAHTGTNAGFFGTAAAVQAGVYTQTYGTADRTLSGYTADDESVGYTGIDNAQVGSVYAQVSELEALRVAYENLRAFTEDAVQMLNATVDDLQSYGLLQ